MEDFKFDYLRRNVLDIIVEIEVICKKLVFNYSKDIEVDFNILSIKMEIVVFGNVKDYLFG